jgi:predicted PurR-regulated permease PerM
MAPGTPALGPEPTSMPPGEAEARREESSRPLPLPATLDIRSITLTGLLLLASVYSLYFAKAILIPIVVALILEALLVPVVRAFRRLRVPEPVGALLVVLGLVGVLGFAVYQLSTPAAEWVRRAPQSLKQLERKVKKLRQPVEQVTRSAEQVEQVIMLDAPRTPEVEIRGPSLMSVLFGGTQAFLIGLALVLVLLYFLLATGDLFLRKLVKVLPARDDKRRAVEIARDVERQVSAFLFTSVAINVGLGVAVALAMHFMGMPNASLWGVLAGSLNFIPYLGPLACTVIIGLAAMLTFEDTGRAMAVPAVYFAVNFVESYLVTPLVMGRRLTLNPVVILVAVMFWGWLWGALGGLLAVPLLVIVKSVCDRVQGLTAVGEFLGP